MKSKKKQDGTFEAGMEALTRLAEQLESGTLSLDESLAAFEEGVRLYRQMQTQLESARLRIETIIADTRAEDTPQEEA